MLIVALAAAAVLLAVPMRATAATGAAVVAGIVIGLFFERRVLLEFTAAVAVCMVLIVCAVYFARLLGFPDWLGAARWDVFQRGLAAAPPVAGTLAVMLVVGLVARFVSRVLWGT